MVIPSTLNSQPHLHLIKNVGIYWSYFFFFPELLGWGSHPKAITIFLMTYVSVVCFPISFCGTLKSWVEPNPGTLEPNRPIMRLKLCEGLRIAAEEQSLGPQWVF